MAVKLDLTQVILVGGAAIAGYYLWSNKLPPFDNMGSFFPESDNLDDEDEEDEEDEELDVIPGKIGVSADFNNKGGTSGDLEEDFFRVLARQKQLLGTSPFSNAPIEVGDPNLTSGPASGTYGNVTFDQYGNLVVVPVPQFTGNRADCISTCKLTCGNLYYNDMAKREACEGGCQNICNVLNANQAISGRRRISKRRMAYTVKSEIKMPKDQIEILGAVSPNDKRVSIKGLINASMQLRPQLSSRTPLHLTGGEVTF